jgi:hypothetical protein
LLFPYCPKTVWYQPPSHPLPHSQSFVCQSFTTP